jgi:hypothetical protein
MHTISTYDSATTTLSNIMQAMCNLPSGSSLFAAAEAHAVVLRRREVSVAEMTVSLHELDVVLKDQTLCPDTLTKVCVLVDWTHMTLCLADGGSSQTGSSEPGVLNLNRFCTQR